MTDDELKSPPKRKRSADEQRAPAKKRNKRQHLGEVPAVIDIESQQVRV